MGLLLVSIQKHSSWSSIRELAKQRDAELSRRNASRLVRMEVGSL